MFGGKGMLKDINKKISLTMSRDKETRQKEFTRREKFYDLYSTGGGIPEDERLGQLALYLNRQTLSQIMFMNELYQKIVDVHGVIVEFGVRYGRNMALFSNLRGIHEPFNHNRKVIGFDTFEGFASIDEKDGGHEVVQEGSFGVPTGYEKTLEQILDYHEFESPIAHIKKYELVKGDAIVTAKEYFKANPHTIVALAYFDFDIYRPTLECLKILKEYTTKGSIIAFDHLNYDIFPGETTALKEIFGLDTIAVKRSPLVPLAGYFVV
jgi:hypothetical protein